MDWLTKALGQRIFFAIFVLFTLGFGFPTFVSFLKGLSSHGYIETECLIVRNGLEKIGEGDASLSLEYSYVFEGKAYSGHRYQWGLEDYASESTQETRGFVREHKPGSRLVCHVNPRHPAESVISKGSRTPAYQVMLLAMASVFGVWGLMMALLQPEWAMQNMVLDGDSSGSD